MNYKALTVIYLILSIAAYAAALTGDVLVDMRQITACLMKLVDQIAPVIALAFFLMGGITYIAAAEDRKQRNLGKKYAIAGLVGIVCVKALIALSAMDPFLVTTGLCPN